jgi:hypothetical protein
MTGEGNGVIEMQRVTDRPSGVRSPQKTEKMCNDNIVQEATSNVYYLSEHGVRRAQVRGVSRNAIDLITQLADRRVRVPGGAMALSISDRGRQRLIDGGLRPSEVDRTCSVVLIADERSHTIITVEHRTRRRRFRH